MAKTMLITNQPTTQNPPINWITPQMWSDVGSAVLATGIIGLIGIVWKTGTTLSKFIIALNRNTDTMAALEEKMGELTSELQVVKKRLDRQEEVMPRMKEIIEEKINSLDLKLSIMQSEYNKQIKTIKRDIDDVTGYLLKMSDKLERPFVAKKRIDFDDNPETF